MVIYFATLSFAIHNLVRYISRNERWKVFSLSMFYLFAIITLASRVVDCILVAKVAIFVNLYAILMPPILKLCIGLVQIVVMVELMITVGKGIKLIENSSASVFSSIHKRSLLDTVGREST